MPLVGSEPNLSPQQMARNDRKIIVAILTIAIKTEIAELVAGSNGREASHRKFQAGLYAAMKRVLCVERGCRDVWAKRELKQFASNPCVIGAHVNLKGADAAPGPHLAGPGVLRLQRYEACHLRKFGEPRQLMAATDVA